MKEGLKQLMKDLELEEKENYSADEAFEILENAFSILYSESRAYAPEDANALADASADGLTNAELMDCLTSMIEEFALFCENIELNNTTGLIDIYSSFDEDPSKRPWWIETTFNRFQKYVG